MDDLIVSCPLCSKRFKVHPDRLPKGVTSFNCRKCGALINIRLPQEPVKPQEGSRTVLVVLDETELADLIVKILARGSLNSKIVVTGEEALNIMDTYPPDAAVISVALPDMMGYEVVDWIRRSDSIRDIPVILLSSLHHGTRFKRAPTSLYGADDYIERHHLPDLLVPKFKNLFQKGAEAKPLDAASGTSEPLSDEEVDERREIERLEDSTAEKEEMPIAEEVSRMARVIAGDILLYNEGTISGSSVEDAKKALDNDIEEGKRVLAARFPEFTGNTADILSEEITKVLQSAGIAPDREEQDGS